MTHVSIQELTKVYPGSDTPALDRLSLEIASGELTALLGPSGCGKTTTMKMIAGLLETTSGDVRFNDRSILRDKPENRGVVMVFQNYLLFPYMSVADNVGFGLKMRRTDPAEIKRRVAEMLDLVKLPDVGGRKPSALSGGQQQRIALARALDRTAGSPVAGRATVEPGCAPAVRDAGPDPPVAAGYGDYDDLRDPRPGGSRCAGRPGGAYS